MRDTGIVRMPVRLQAIEKQIDNARPAKLTRRQTDVMHDDQLDLRINRSCIAIGRRHMAHAITADKPVVSQSHGACAKYPAT